jgi:hypothetical protein
MMTNAPEKFDNIVIDFLKKLLHNFKLSKKLTIKN